jgi:hypothetical protein
VLAVINLGEQSSCDVNNFSLGPEIDHYLWGLRIHCHDHRSPLLARFVLRYVLACSPICV